MKELRLVTWQVADPDYLHDMLQAILVWDKEEGAGMAVWDLSHPESGKVSAAYTGFYGRGYHAYMHEWWVFKDMPAL